MELHFYPGDKVLLVMKGTKTIAKVEAWGGPAKVGNDPRMKEIPTTAGTFIIHSMYPYKTRTWPMSMIKWGTPLKDKPGKNDVWYKLRNGRWASVKRDIGLNRTELIQEYEKYFGKPDVPKTWIFNDFGPMAIRYFKDKDGNRKLDKKKGEKLSGEMIHTTPLNEAQFQRGQAVTLGPSHGCLHIRPQDRNTLKGLGAFESGTTFVVHKYTESP